MDKRIGWNNGRETEETDIQTGRETEWVGKTEREREAVMKTEMFKFINQGKFTTKAENFRTTNIFQP